MTEPVDWYEKGRQHFQNCLTSPHKAKADYPTQDTHPPSDEAEFIRGFQAARAEHIGASLIDEPNGSSWLEDY